MTEIKHVPSEIYTKKLSKYYGKGEKSVKAVNKINIDIAPGIHGFLGPNGAGKTSTINMLIGAISISDGRAEIQGFKAGSAKARRLIGFLPQDPSFYEKMSGKQYLLYMAQLNGLRRKQATQKADELLKFLDLNNAKDRKIGKYSGGMKQKIGIAAALIHDPEILILDEPTANLDPLGRADLVEKIIELSKKMSVFVSSHILSEIEQMCTNVTMINNGKIVLTNTIKNIKRMHSASANLYSLDTDSNEILLPILKSKDFITKVWIDEKNKKIQIIPNNNDDLQLNLPKLLVETKVMLKSFFLQESSLQDIFIDIIEGDENNK